MEESTVTTMHSPLVSLILWIILLLHCINDVNRFHLTKSKIFLNDRLILSIKWCCKTKGKILIDA
jgi:hypothetical protein